MDHPLHPATVHWPIAFLSSSYAIDTLLTTWSYLPAVLTSLLPNTTELSRISYYALSLGLLASVPSVMSGGAQAYKMIQAQGIYTPDRKIKPKVKIVVAHALVNDVVIAGSAYSWWQRRESAAARLVEGKNPAEYEIAGGNAGMSVLLGLLIMYGAYLGGALVYDYGMGLAMGKKVIKGEKQG